jgi:hypothetical protein
MGADSVEWGAGTQKRFDRTMKTQLLQDLNESGSANAKPQTPEAKGQPDTAHQRDATVRPDVPAAEAATPVRPADVTAVNPALAPAVKPAEAPAVAPAAPAPRSGPAVWQRPQQPWADTTVPAPEPAPAPAQVRASAPEPVGRIEPRPAAPLRDVHADPARFASPKGFAPQALPFDTPVPERDAAHSADRDPDWLAERLAREAALHESSEWSEWRGSWGRRVAAWGAAGVLLAMVAAGGLWLYEQRQDEGALVLLANTNSAPPTGITRPAAPRALPALPASTELAATPTPTPAATAPAASPAVTPVTPPAQDAPLPSTSAVGQSTRPATASAAGDTANGTTVEAPGVIAVDTAAAAKRAVLSPSGRARPGAEPQTKRKRDAARKQTKTVASAAGREGARGGAREGERSYRQRYEETLMQCRAHGYDERQCMQRGCEMTRFGFACKG